jgi:prepilin-type N-terminal cleavage/methylation domain-containing protein
MRNLPRFRPAVRQNGGFTLVELLVVIGIIAILAGVAMGPITNGIKKAQESSAMQTCRTIALAEFQYSNDNNSSYPDGKDAGAVVTNLIGGNYVTDPSIFKIAADTTYVPPATVGTYTSANCSYDFMGAGTTYTGLPSTTPDQCPVVWSAGDTGCVAPTGAGGVSFVPAAGIFGKDGVAVAYHSNNSFFRTPNHNTNVTYPPIGSALFVDNTVDFSSLNLNLAVRMGDR